MSLWRWSMCGDCPDIHNDQVNPMYAISAPRREPYNPLRLEGLAGAYGARRDPAMQYRLADLDVVERSYAKHDYRPAAMPQYMRI
jgi:hypothetical protein